MSFIQRQVPPFYRSRTFSDKFSDTTDFITVNWRVLLRMLTITLLPLCVIQALNINGLVSAMYGDFLGDNGTVANSLLGFALNYGSLVVFGIIGTAIFISVVYTTMKLYHEQNADGTPAHPDLNNMTFVQLRPIMLRQMRQAWKGIGASLLLSLAIGIVAMSVAMVVALSGTAVGAENLFIGFGVLLAYAVIFTLIPPVIMALPVMSFEKIKFWAGVRKSVVYGVKTWRGTIAVLIVMGLLTGVVLGVLGMPWIVLMMIKAMFVADDMSEFAFSGSLWYSFLMFLGAIVYIYACYIGYTVMLVAMAYQYGHAREKLEGEDFYASDNTGIAENF